MENNWYKSHGDFTEDQYLFDQPKYTIYKCYSSRVISSNRDCVSTQYDYKYVRVEDDWLRLWSWRFFEFTLNDNHHTFPYLPATSNWYVYG